jgi:hypothetical protein
MTADTEHHHRAVAWSRIGRRWAWGLAFGVITIVALALRIRSAAPAHGWYARPREAT